MDLRWPAPCFPKHLCTLLPRAAIGRGTVSDATVRESFALAANLACMVPGMGLHGISR